MSDQNKTVLITGASAGIGKSFAEVFFGKMVSILSLPQEGRID